MVETSKNPTMSEAEYKKIREAAKPVVAKIRMGKDVTPAEKELVAASIVALDKFFAIKKPMCYVAGFDTRRVLPSNMTYDKEYKRSLKNVARRAMRKMLSEDITYAQANNKTELVAGLAQKSLRAKNGEVKKIELQAKRDARAEIRAKNKVAREALKATRAQNKIKRDAARKAKITAQAKALGIVK